VIRAASWLGAVWLLAVAIGSWWIASRPAAPTDRWTTLRDLPLNHQLRAIDIAGPSERSRLARMAKKDALVGRHLTAPKRKGDSIDDSHIAPQPVVVPGESGSAVLIYSLKGEEQLADGVEIGSWVVPCFVRPGDKPSGGTTTRCAKGAVAVEVVHRAVSSSDATWLALRVPQCWTAEIGEYVSRDKRFLLVAAHPTRPAPVPPSAGVRAR
jgi:hypothetical protein